MIALLAAQLIVISRQLERTSAQQVIAERQLDATLPILQAATPLATRARSRQDEVEAQAERLDRLVRETRPLVRETRPLVSELTPLTEELRAAGAPRAIAATGALARDLAERDRLVRLVDRADRVLADLDARELSRSPELLRQTLRVQRELLAIQKQALAVLREAERHVERIDQRTGGAATPPVTASRSPAR